MRPACLPARNCLGCLARRHPADRGKLHVRLPEQRPIGLEAIGLVALVDPAQRRAGGADQQPHAFGIAGAGDRRRRAERVSDFSQRGLKPYRAVGAAAATGAHRPNIIGKPRQYPDRRLGPVEFLDDQAVDEGLERPAAPVAGNAARARRKIRYPLRVDDAVSSLAAHQRRGDVGSPGSSGQARKLEVRIAATVTMAAGATEAGAGRLPAKQQRCAKGGAADRHRSTGLLARRPGQAFGRRADQRPKAGTGRDPAGLRDREGARVGFAGTGFEAARRRRLHGGKQDQQSRARQDGRFSSIHRLSSSASAQPKLHKASSRASILLAPARSPRSASSSPKYSVAPLCSGAAASACR